MSRLTEIRERFNAIIPGPWRWYGNTATDQVSLATRDRGRLFILDTHTFTAQYVYDHDEMETYTLERARENVINWCNAHGEDSDPTFREADCCCDRLREFLAGDLSDSSDQRRFDHDRLPGARGSLTRGVTVHPDLRFPDKSLGDRRPEHGGMMRSYREAAKYEVLGFRTVTEWEMDQGGGVPSVGHDIKDHLYREDFCGIDTPEATFIERAPEDIDYLLKRLDAAEGLIVALRNWVTWENRGQALQGTADARVLAVRAEREWDDACAEEQ